MQEIIVSGQMIPRHYSEASKIMVVTFRSLHIYYLVRTSFSNFLLVSIVRKFPLCLEQLYFEFQYSFLLLLPSFYFTEASF
jgi:hypothetical protein